MTRMTVVFDFLKIEPTLKKNLRSGNPRTQGVDRDQVWIEKLILQTTYSTFRGHRAEDMGKWEGYPSPPPRDPSSDPIPVASQSKQAYYMSKASKYARPLPLCLLRTSLCPLCDQATLTYHPPYSLPKTETFVSHNAAAMSPQLDASSR